MKLYNVFACKTLFKIILICSLSVTSVSVFAQDNSKEIKRIEKLANGHFDVDEFADALPLLLRLDSLKPNDAQTLYKIGVSYYNAHDQFDSFKYFDRVRGMDFHKDHHMLDYYLGVSLHLNNKFEEAISALEKYKSEFLSDSKYKAHVLVGASLVELTVEDIDKEIAECRFAKELVKNPIKVKIENLGPSVNTADPEYAPVISADETKLIFTARRHTTSGGEKDFADNLHFEDVYISYHNGDKWTTAENMGATINTDDHDASIGLSPDGQELFLYKSDVKNEASGDIYLSELDGKSWKAPVKLSENVNTLGMENHASITSDESFLYFTSNKPGGQGGLDIYVSKKLPDNTWGLPTSLGSEINTKYDEEAPFINPDGRTLYFSSKGHKSMGGFDIFKSVYNEKSKTWSAPENLGYPINTSADDIFFVWTPDGKKAYFSSYRAGGYGHEDIYVLTKEDDNKNDVVVLKGNVLSAVDKKPVGAIINVIDNSTKKLISSYKANAATGHYVVILPSGKDYGISVEAANHLFYSENVSVPANTYKEIQKDYIVEPIQSGSMINLNNVFFETNSSELKESSFPELDKVVKILKENPSIYFRIDGHTDSIGSADYNYILSNLRTESIAQYLVKSGSEAKRLITVGNGPDEPAAENSTEEGRAQNRRSTITLIDFEKDKPLYNASLEKQVRMAKKAKSIKTEKVDDESAKNAVPLLKNFDDPTIYFFLNDVKVNEESKLVLDKLVAVLLANPKVNVELDGFYSKKDGEKSKAALYLKRSVWVADYLVMKKVDKKRILVTDFSGEKKDGETYRTDRNHNRRVEVKLIGR